MLDTMGSALTLVVKSIQTSIPTLDGSVDTIQAGKMLGLMHLGYQPLNQYCIVEAYTRHTVFTWAQSNISALIHRNDLLAVSEIIHCKEVIPCTTIKHKYSWSSLAY